MWHKAYQWYTIWTLCYGISFFAFCSCSTWASRAYRYAELLVWAFDCFLYCWFNAEWNACSPFSWLQCSIESTLLEFMTIFQIYKGLLQFTRLPSTCFTTWEFMSYVQPTQPEYSNELRLTCERILNYSSLNRSCSKRINLFIPTVCVCVPSLSPGPAIHRLNSL